MTKTNTLMAETAKTFIAGERKREFNWDSQPQPRDVAADVYADSIGVPRRVSTFRADVDAALAGIRDAHVEVLSQRWIP